MRFQKFFILSAIFFLTFTCEIRKLNAQYQYCEFPTEDATWMSRLSWYIGPFVPLYIDREFILIDEDTIFSGVTYRKIIKRERRVETGNEPSLNNIISDLPDEFFGGIREEDKKIFLNRMGDERLLYDFNMSIGDTVHTVSQPGQVTSIDTVELGNKLRKRFEVTVFFSGSTFVYHIIEGIGATVDLHPDAPGIDDVELICMKVLNEVQYQSDNYSFCPTINDWLTTNNNDTFNSSYISIHPNPANEFFYFNIEGPTKISGLKIYDSTGKLIHKKNTVSSGEKINSADWPAGLYIMSFQNKNHIITQKLIKR